jgi:ABC-type dipeptide/oligopeptide/nickel transport system ATPase component
MLEVKDLRTEFKIEQGIVHAVNGVSYTVDERRSWAWSARADVGSRSPNSR